MLEAKPRNQPAVVDVAGLERRLNDLERRHDAAVVVIMFSFAFEPNGFAMLMGIWLLFGATKFVFRLVFQP